jgi:holo-[acyl-carrier protein] synthase
MILGIGVDVVAISRFARFVEENNVSLLERIFTHRERDYCAARKLSAQHYALRFAAKEAFLKSLGTGLRDGLSWQDMEVVNDDLGKPGLLLTGRASEVFTERRAVCCHLSLSHDADAAVAMVVLEGP